MNDCQDFPMLSFFERYIGLFCFSSSVALKLTFSFPFPHSPYHIDSHHKKEDEKVEEQVVSMGDKKFTVSEEYSKALADAKAVTEEKGIQSSEARLAWELVEELGATQAHHKSVGSG